MQKLIAIGLSPDTTWQDARLAMSILLAPRKWLGGGKTREFEKKLSLYLEAKFCFAFESGRSSLLAILFSLGLKEGDEVLLQAYTCVAVPDPILWAGLKPVYVDINKKSFNMSPGDLSKKITPRSKALIIQHTFGMPAEMDQLLKIARDNKLMVIEDCAHALGSEYKNKKLGTFGDAAIFSFGRDKVISSVFGGAVATSNKELADKIATFQRKCGFPSRVWVFKQLIYPILTEFIKSSYSFGLGKLLMIILRRLNLLSKSVYPEEKVAKKPSFVPSKMPNALSSLALYQFSKLERFNRVRKEIAGVYFKSLKSFPMTLPQEDSSSIYLRFTVLTPVADKIRQFCAKRNIFLGDWYNVPIAPRGVSYKAIGYKIGSSKNAEDVAEFSLNLPTNPHLGKKDLRRVIQAIKDFYKQSQDTLDS